MSKIILKKKKGAKTYTNVQYLDSVALCFPNTANVLLTFASNGSEVRHCFFVPANRHVMSPGGSSTGTITPDVRNVAAVGEDDDDEFFSADDDRFHVEKVKVSISPIFVKAPKFWEQIFIPRFIDQISL
jgi:hypothetical protein